MKEFLIQDSAAFKLRAVVRGCASPADLNYIEFVREQYNDKGELIDSSAYQFFLNNQELKIMTEGLVV